MLVVAMVVLVLVVGGGLMEENERPLPPSPGRFWKRTAVGVQGAEEPGLSHRDRYWWRRVEVGGPLGGACLLLHPPLPLLRLSDF